MIGHHMTLTCLNLGRGSSGDVVHFGLIKEQGTRGFGFAC
jgi:hypothetical protein